MPVVIDGNNLLHAARSVGKTSLLIGRSMLCDTLAAWGQKRREHVHVIFDGPAPPPALAEQIAHPAIDVSFSGRGVSADTVIGEVVARSTVARRLLVVSTDREVARVAKRHGASSIRSEDFWIQLERDLARPVQTSDEPEEEKKRGMSRGVDEWLREFGFDAGGSDDVLRDRGIDVDEPDPRD